MAGKGPNRREGEDTKAFGDGYEEINWDSKRKDDERDKEATE